MKQYIDLHLHLDGSLSPETILKLAKKDRIKLPADTPEKLKKYLIAPENCSSLNEYLEKFDIPISVLQSKQNLHDSVYYLLEDLKKINCIYSEIRFAPQLHCKKGLNQKEVVQACVEGLNDGMKDFGVKSNLILCCMRGEKNDTVNLDTVRVAGKFIHKGVCALDLAGAEAVYATRNFRDLFRIVENMEIPFTIHAGEAAGAESIKEAILFGARRIGHGCSAFDDPSLVETIRYKNIGVECCPTSNLQTKAVIDYASHPIWKFLQNGVLCTVNSDNMTVSDTDVKREFDHLYEDSRFSDKIYNHLLRNSIYSSFLSEEEKDELFEKVGGK